MMRGERYGFNTWSVTTVGFDLYVGESGISLGEPGGVLEPNV